MKNEESIASISMFSYDRDAIRIIWVLFSFLLTVASLTRCVDWNHCRCFCCHLFFRRIAHAVRGLKFVLIQDFFAERSSHRSRGAWIEILDPSDKLNELIMSHRSRGAWIEIRVNQHRDIVRQVASLTRCVDWNNAITVTSSLISSHRSHDSSEY